MGEKSGANKSCGPFQKVLDSLSSRFVSPEPEVIFEGDSEHNHIQVIEAGDVRTMCFGPMGQEAETSISLSNPLAPVFEYPGLMFLALALTDRNKEILMLGLGGGFVPRLFQEFLPEHKLTVVEIDPLVGELASTYFFFQPGKNVTLVYADGGEFIKNAEPERYDQIWLDAFNGNYIPHNLATDDFTLHCLKALPQGGILSQNLHQTRLSCFRAQIQRTTRLFGGMPLIFNGVRCGNSVSHSLKDEGEFDPSIKEIARKVRNFRLTIGPYKLLDEAKKKEKYPANFL
ncbi:MAG: fused MFS/spermidine synthase [Deltaproteobacteria bacterium]|jgi:spermidine synthase|nr:fused MFS/spermidine synthase [Deltaproteobacteria bacterium]